MAEIMAGEGNIIQTCLLRTLDGAGELDSDRHGVSLRQRPIGFSLSAALTTLSFKSSDYGITLLIKRNQEIQKDNHAYNRSSTPTSVQSASKLFS